MPPTKSWVVKRRLHSFCRSLLNRIIAMGACISTPHRRPRSRRRYIIRFRRCHGKISASVPDAPSAHFSNKANHLPEFGRSECGHNDTAAVSRRKSEVSNLTFHLTQLQWHHSQSDANGIVAVPAFHYSQSPQFLMYCFSTIHDLVNFLYKLDCLFP